MHVSDQAAEAAQGEAGRCHILFCGQNAVRMLKGSMYASRHALTFTLRRVQASTSYCRLCRPGHSGSVKTRVCNSADMKACCAYGLRSLFQQE